MDGEPSLDEARSFLLSRNFDLCFPRLGKQSNTMDFRLVCDWYQDFERHPWGMLEPRESCTVVPQQEIRGVFVPLLAFDDQGNRLGKGKAFYDRFLNGFKGLKLGIGFEWQHSAYRLPKEPHDIGLDVVVTEEKVYHFQN